MGTVKILKDVMRDLGMDWLQTCLWLALKQSQARNQPHLTDLSHWGFNKEQLDELFAHDWINEYQILVMKV